jgi:predicted hydrolase (HD superfamily)
MGSAGQPPRVPGDQECFDYWNRYGMLDNIREHSLRVADLATAIADASMVSAETGKPSRSEVVDSARAAGLLHDLAKTYTIKHGGNHSQLGGAWVKELTGNAPLAQAVVHHVFWPFSLDPVRYLFQLILIYADKRVRHTELVTLEERFEDLYDRYGKTEEIRRKIGVSHEQALAIEHILSSTVGFDLHARTVDSGRLV